MRRATPCERPWCRFAGYITTTKDGGIDGLTLCSPECADWVRRAYSVANSPFSFDAELNSAVLSWESDTLNQRTAPCANRPKARKWGRRARP